MPLTNTDEIPNSRRLKLVQAQTFIRKLASKLFFDPLQTIISIFGLLTLIFDLFAEIEFMWYVVYAILIIGYFVDKNYVKKEEKDQNNSEKEESEQVLFKEKE